jgi:hypothetical protein
MDDRKIGEIKARGAGVSSVRRPAALFCHQSFCPIPCDPEREAPGGNQLRAGIIRPLPGPLDDFC